MYNVLVHHSTGFLDGQRTKKLRLNAAMDAASELRAIRMSLGLTVRQIATQMGAPEVPNTYGYYESGKFSAKPLPLQKAREIARAVEALSPGAGARILPLAGLTNDEAASETAKLRVDMPPPSVVAMAVTLPNDALLIAMFEGLLELADHGDLAAELAPRLAENFPAALARMTARQISAQSALPPVAAPAEQRSLEGRL
jgi:transcriptional regulator with XRE-family HTH domain